MNRKRIIILISALIVSALIVWHDLPLEFPGTMFKVVMLFVKLFIVIALASLAYVFAGGKKKSS
jgi:small-conductance mechanosensitive channel